MSDLVSRGANMANVFHQLTEHEYAILETVAHADM